MGHLARVFARHRGGSFHPTSKLAPIVRGLAIDAQVLTALAARVPPWRNMTISDDRSKQQRYCSERM